VSALSLTKTLTLLDEPLVSLTGGERSHFAEYLHRWMPGGVRGFVVAENLGTSNENTMKIVSAIHSLREFAPYRRSDRLFIDRSAEVGSFLGSRMEQIAEACSETGFPISQVVYVSQNTAVGDGVVASGAKWLFFHHYYVTMARHHPSTNDHGYDMSGDHILLLNSKTRPHRIALLATLLSEPFAARIEWSWRANSVIYGYERALDEAKREFPSAAVAIDLQGTIPTRDLKTPSVTERIEDLAPELKRCFLEVVAETNHELWVNRITEKSLKPIAGHRPFMVFGSAGSLSILRRLGFETFGSVWDESYDQVDDPDARLQALLTSIREVVAMDFNEVKRRCKDICARNQAHLSSGFMQRFDWQFGEDVAGIWR
jgi:hypothetical protein